MSEGQGPSAGAILLAIFLILFGLCVTLLGGGCTAMWVYLFFTQGALGGGSGLAFLISVVMLAGGAVTLWVGVKMLMGKYRA